MTKIQKIAHQLRLIQETHQLRLTQIAYRYHRYQSPAWQQRKLTDNEYRRYYAEMYLYDTLIVR